MRVLLKIKLPGETSNRLAAKGTLGQTLGDIVEETKPEVVYFGEEDGKRTAFLVVDIDGMHKIPSVCEPWFLAFNASVSITPVMTPGDLAKAGPDMEKAASKYAS